ncbi:F-box domain-containing protein [Meloidogyne graminicola]|uniref:F-box domain-containing protein n=1 Tax=Meloidogyne graminicola TaxID=189291 RepID=A0A8S9ZTT6_9BILA|nr:F-box domain-containing protein [Meloidogyne graminicola]
MKSKAKFLKLIKSLKLMEHLPPELQLKILQNLNFDELFLIKQTNRHFYDFINKYKESWARKEFNMFCFTTSSIIDEVGCFPGPQRELDKSLKEINFALNDQLKEKWLSALDKKIPVFIINNEFVSGHEPLLFLFDEINKRGFNTFEFPLYPKIISQMKFVYY